MKKILRCLNTFSRIALIFCAVCLVLHIFFLIIPAFADTFNSSIGRGVRFIFAKISDPVPFSIGEFVLFFSPILIFIICRAVAAAAKKSAVHAWRAAISTVLAASLIWCIFVLDFEAGYRGTSLADKFSLKDDPVSADELYYTIGITISNLNELCDSLDYLSDGSSVMPFSVYDLSEKLCSAYDNVCEKYAFIDRYKSKVKPLVISRYMTYTHISGIYSFFTGEANLNTNFPDYICAYTAAHEMAHQRGISREDEANFTAFLVCIESEDAYIRYSAYLNMYEYLSTALYKASPDLYADAFKELSPKVRGELSAYSNFFDKYRDNTAAKVSDKVNNAYLTSQGTAGVASYGMVVDLAVAYYSQ